MKLFDITLPNGKKVKTSDFGSYVAGGLFLMIVAGTVQGLAKRLDPALKGATKGVLDANFEIGQAPVVAPSTPTRGTYR